MKYAIIIIIALGLITGCQTSNELRPVPQVKPGVAKEGSLANAKLIADTIKALKQLPDNSSINSDTKILKFVIQHPVGSPGSRSWREMWIVNPKGVSKSYLITFKEAGLGAADFDIKPMKTK